MEALNVTAEYRKTFPEQQDATQEEVQQWVGFKVHFGEWVEDDGDYYTREEWDSQYTAEDNFRSWLDETEPED